MNNWIFTSKKGRAVRFSKYNFNYRKILVVIKMFYNLNYLSVKSFQSTVKSLKSVTQI